jgi:UDP-2,3-diacylglucosamine pyrophosphatase LpxH
MLAWARETGADFDLRIVERDLMNAIDLLVARALPAKRAALINIGDFFHAQSDDQLTPHGKNKLDVDGRNTKILEIGVEILERLVYRILQKHELVEVYNVAGNHDPQMAALLAVCMKRSFKENPRVTVRDASNAYQYLRFGKNLVGVCHGDGPKIDDLPEIMATDRAPDWGETLYRLWITGHVHHLSRKEMRGCSVETLRTLATRDAWHHGKGYRSGQSISCIILDEEYGEVDRPSIDLRLIRAKRIK